MSELNHTEETSVELLSASKVPLTLRCFSRTGYAEALQAMQDFSEQRDASTQDQIWLIEHPPTYTQGTACEQQTLMPSNIPVVKTDRGGQITYHGPGQIVLYPLLHLRRFNLGVKALVNALEQSVINLLENHHVQGQRREDAPGIYVDGAKIAALGLRIRRGNSYHGLSLNVDMDLAPFRNIDPCGYQGLQITQLSDLLQPTDEQGNKLIGELSNEQIVVQNMLQQHNLGQQLVEQFIAQI